MKYILETERLRMREFTLDDTAFIVKLLNSPGWLQFIGDKNVKSGQQAISYLENGPLLSYVQNGFGLSLVERKEDSASIGMCGIIKRDNLPAPDIGFAFLPDYHGKGYAFEIVSATLVYAKEVLGLPKIAAIAMANNKRSISLLQKVGLQFVATFSFAGQGEELLLYSN